MPPVIESPWLVPFDGTFRVGGHPTFADDLRDIREKDLEKRLEALVAELRDLQRCMYAHDRYAVLLVFQAMDAAGKDGTIRALLTGVNPAGCQVFSFKQPSRTELDHDFLWRTASRLPERGRIGVFNRSYYEEVIVVRVHPELLAGQHLPEQPFGDVFWETRYASIRDHERHLDSNGTVVLKFWLNVSRDEQCRRFISRIDDPKKNWKFSAGDVAERSRWDDYMRAYEAALNATSRPWAPWYAIPADDKDASRLIVADIVVRTLRALPLRYPELDEEALRNLGRYREQLASDLSGDPR